MEPNRIGRRHVLRRAGLAAGGAAVATATAASPAFAGGGNNGDDASALTGGWFLDRQTTVGKARGVITFASGGSVQYQDISPANVVVLHGAWSRSEGAFRFEMWGGAAADTATGAPAIVVRIKGQVTLNRRGFTSPYIATWFDPVSNNEVFRFDGAARGTRIEP